MKLFVDGRRVIDAQVECVHRDHATIIVFLERTLVSRGYPYVRIHIKYHLGMHVDIIHASVRNAIAHCERKHVRFSALVA